MSVVLLMWSLGILYLALAGAFTTGVAYAGVA